MKNFSEVGTYPLSSSSNGKELPMSSRLNPYLNFRGNTKRRWSSTRGSGGTSNVNTFGEYGEHDP